MILFIFNLLLPVIVRLYRVIRSCIELGDKNPIVSIHDQVIDALHYTTLHCTALHCNVSDLRSHSSPFLPYLHPLHVFVFVHSLRQKKFIFHSLRFHVHFHIHFKHFISLNLWYYNVTPSLFFKRFSSSLFLLYSLLSSLRYVRPPIVIYHRSIFSFLYLTPATKSYPFSLT